MHHIERKVPIMTIPADEEMIRLVREILADAGKGYTPEQLAEIPSILATKYKYWWCVDMQLWDVMPEVLTEPFSAYSNGRLIPNKSLMDQVNRSSVVCDDSMVPMHMGHNAIVQFTSPTTCRLLTRLNDYHTYIDDQSTYEGWGLYVDDLVKCDDGVWRIQTLRLTYRKLLGKLRNKGV